MQRTSPDLQRPGNTLQHSLFLLLEAQQSAREYIEILDQLSQHLDPDDDDGGQMAMLRAFTKASEAQRDHAKELLSIWKASYPSSLVLVA
jgi:hypothetical protein